MKSKTKVLVISVSGIGNTILQSPLIGALAARSDLGVDVLFGNESMARVFRNDVSIESSYILPLSWRERVKLIWRLRSHRYEYSIVCFPSNRIEFHVLPFLIGAQQRVIHSYRVGQMRTLSFLSNVKISTDEALHDVEQNMNLLRIFGLNPSTADRTLHFSVNEEDRKVAGDYFHRQGLANKEVLGIHAGCKRSESYRRWPSEKFISLINQCNVMGIHCLLFAGPDEREETRQMMNAVRMKSMNVCVEESNLNHVAAMIGRCHKFLSTDSGLGHIAITQGVLTFALFGPGMPSRTAPYGPLGHYITFGLEICNCFGYPFRATHSRVRCPYRYRCLDDLTVKEVIKKMGYPCEPRES